MEPDRLIEALSFPEAYPENTFRDFEVHQTHISVVFLAGDLAYKVKKPVDLEFLDFTTLERRLYFCREEVRLNRRLAPGVYLGVVPVTETDGGLRMEGEGEPVEYAVKMRRLPPEARLLARLEHEQVSPQLVKEIARRIAAFHVGAAAGPRVSRQARFSVVAGNARENLDQSRAHVGETISCEVFDRFSALQEKELEELHPLIERRADRDVPRDTHGDLHLDHVYLFPEQDPPADVIAIDCIEFNERFRYADPVADMAFLVMDLLYHRRADLAHAFAEAYFDAAGDDEGRRLLPFYVAYRAAVRGKVEGMITEEEEVPAAERRSAVDRSRAHWLLALAQLEVPAGRPCLVLVGGLPGTGKTTLAESLARRSGFVVLSSDLTRKELAGLDPETSTAAEFGAGIYTAEWNERTYDALLNRAAEGLFRGERILVDASFREEGGRRAFLKLAPRFGVPGLLFLCEAPAAVVLGRLATGTPRSGSSDADQEIYRHAAEAWENPSSDTAADMRRVDTGGPLEASVQAAVEHLRGGRLA